METFSLKNKTVLITGSEGFLGQHFKKALKSAGATVIATDITGTPDITLDVTDQASVDAAFEQIVKDHGRIDVVINNAAINPKFDADADQNQLTFENYPEDAMQQSIDVNLLGTWRVCKTAVKYMKEQHPSTSSTGSEQASSGLKGNIVNVASFYGVTPPRQEIYPEGTEKPVDYPVTKAAVIMLTRHLASQFGPVGIRANALAPGGVLKNHDKAFQQKYAAHTSLGRMNTPDEIADALVFLASDASRGMTGEVLTVDAGWSSR